MERQLFFMLIGRIDKAMYKNLYKYDDMKRSQHEAVRNTVGWYDFTHQLLEVTGKDASVFLDRIYPNPIANLKIGSARYTTMLNEEGLIIDDVVIFRLEENKYWISTLYIRDLIIWLDAHKEGYSVAYSDITANSIMYAVQGPKSKDLLNAFLAKTVDDQKFFTIQDNKIDNVPVKISMAGFTGEKVGYEIYVAPTDAELVESKLIEHGEKIGAVQVTDFQVMVWTLPTEKGFYLMCDIRGVSPLEVGLDRGIDWSKDFIGKAAALELKAEEPKRKMLGYIVDEDDAQIQAKDKGSTGAAVMLNDEEVGRVTKYTYGFTAEKSIGYALIYSAKAKVGDKVTINDYSATLVDKIFA
jgi:aminomethyltransferase